LSVLARGGSLRRAHLLAVADSTVHLLPPKMDVATPDMLKERIRAEALAEAVPL
jgi:hypothetical protein